MTIYGDRNVRIGLLLAKVETTIGTDASPTAAANSLLLTDPIADPGGTFIVKSERPKAVTGYITGQPQLQLQGRWASWQIKMQCRGTKDGLAYSGSDLPDWDPLMQAAGFASTTSGATQVYTPLSTTTSLKTVTLYYYVDGILYKMLGGTVSSVALNLSSGGPLTMDFTVEGLYVGQAAASFPTTQVFGATIPPTIDNASYSFFSYTNAIVRSFNVHIQNETSGPRLSLSATTGIVPSRVRSRRIEWTAVMEHDLPSAFDVEGTQVANTLGTISWSQTGTQYNQIAFSAPKAQIKEVKYGNDKLTEIATVSGEMFDNAGNDAMTLTMS